MRNALLMGLITLSFLSCHPGKKGIFGKALSAHEQYADRLEKAGLSQSVLAKKWLAAAQRSIAQPSRITIPHTEAGYFAAGEPDAAGLSCELRRGSVLNVSVQTVPEQTAKIFVELWKIDTSSDKRERIAEGDTTFHITHEVENDGLYLIRLQPELLSSMGYTLTVTTQPSLAFPVDQNSKPALISFWNDRRDAGRNHEGVDIKAPFRSPAVAAADGYVRSVTTNRLGGKVVFMRPEGKEYALYYAHLDSQTVSMGQNVTKGDTIGLIGNTGNAIHTPPHLHFGIYARGGAVDPLPFIDPRPVPLADINSDRSLLNQFARTTKRVKIFEMPDLKADTVQSLPQGAPVKIISATKNWYRVATQTFIGYIQGAVVTQKPLKDIKTDMTTRLVDAPDDSAPAMALIPAGTVVPVLAAGEKYYRVRFADREGWIIR